MLATVALAALALGGCDKTAPGPPTPLPLPLPITTAPITAGGPDTSVPDAATVVTPADTVAPDPAAGQSNSTLSDAQESRSMPLPGQNNDHSVIDAPARPASAP
jgi:hypothetical protein